MRRIALVLVLLGLAVTYAQQRGRGRRFAPPPPPSETLSWEVDSRFRKDVFTFVRVRYTSTYERYRGGGWQTDYPDSDNNFSFRLQQMTALKVNPEPVILELTDKELWNYPWIYFVEPGALVFSEDEVEILRKYLLNGGFAMFDDFWGVRAYENLYDQLKRVFPDREPQDIPMNHPVFNCVFPLNEKLEGRPPQIPNVGRGMQSEWDHITWEQADAQQAEYKAIYDDKGRMVVIICHNTDLGDGWEEEGVSEYYFREFSEKKAYPLGINIVFYAMTH
jgi:hypothetical protein